LKNKIPNKSDIPSTSNDVIIAFIFTVIVVSLYGGIFQYVGSFEKLDTAITSFFGAIIAFSGIMTKQYFYKETIDYLILWNRSQGMISEILSEQKIQD
jgi:hypothetical protein